jgi:transposase
VSYRKQHHYLTVVANHRTGDVVWCDEGKDTAAAERFYDALGEARSHQLRAVSMDMGKAYPKVTRRRRRSAGTPTTWSRCAARRCLSGWGARTHLRSVAAGR